MRVENPFRAGDKVRYIGKRRQLSHLRDGFHVRNGLGERIRVEPPVGTVIGIWRKNGKHMVDVEWADWTKCAVPHTELKFDVLDTLSAL